MHQEDAEPVIVGRPQTTIVQILDVALIVERCARVEAQSCGRESGQCDQQEEGDEPLFVSRDHHCNGSLLG